MSMLLRRAMMKGAAPVTYATWNPSDKGSSLTLSGGNLTVTASSGIEMVRSTIGKSSGKWYWEIGQYGSASNNYLEGIANLSAPVTNYGGSNANSWAYYGNNGTKYVSASPAAYGASFTSGHTIGVALDMDAGTVTFYKNNVSQGVAFTGLTGTIYAQVSGGSEPCTYVTNFGASAFVYAPPSGYNAGLYA